MEKRQQFWDHREILHNPKYPNHNQELLKNLNSVNTAMQILWKLVTKNYPFEIFL